MSSVEKFDICTAPLNERCVKSRNMLMRYLEKHTNREVPGLSYSMQPKAAKSLDNLADLCSLHHQLELFLWLHNKVIQKLLMLALDLKYDPLTLVLLHDKYPSNFVEAYRAIILKDRTSEMINNGLLKADRLSLKHDYVFSDARKKKEWENERQNNK